jgi:hypothetical protein
MAINLKGNPFDKFQQEINLPLIKPLAVGEHASLRNDWRLANHFTFWFAQQADLVEEILFRRQVLVDVQTSKPA